MLTRVRLRKRVELPNLADDFIQSVHGRVLLGNAGCLDHLVEARHGRVADYQVDELLGLLCSNLCPVKIVSPNSCSSGNRHGAALSTLPFDFVPPIEDRSGLAVIGWFPTDRAPQ